MFFIVWNIKSQVVSQLQGLLCLFSFLKHLVCSSLDILVSPSTRKLPVLGHSFGSLEFQTCPCPILAPLSSHYVMTHFSCSSYCQLYSAFYVPYFQFSTGVRFPVLIVMSQAKPEYWQTHGLAAIDSAPGRHLLALVSQPLAQKLWMSPFLSEGKSGLCPPSSL